MQHPTIEIERKSKEYPKLLAQIHDPPEQLYCRGNTALLNTFCFGVVGTRKITAYGKEATENIIAGLSDTGWTIVSGLALGVDAVAHKAALDNGLPTIAVLGSNVEDEGIGPRSNLPLAKEILNNNGLIISEYKSEKDINKSNFAVRDRIISGLSKGVLVIEGAEQSGSLITAKSAADQGRDVFAVPGNIFSSVSKGTNSLIKSGAKMVTSADDILYEYEQNLKLNMPSTNNISTKNPTEQKILDILDEKGELSGDEIIREAGEEPSKIIASISMLELKGAIKRRSGKYQKI